MDQDALLKKLDSLISYWNQKWADPQTQIRADAYIEAFDYVKEWLLGAEGNQANRTPLDVTDALTGLT